MSVFKQFSAGMSLLATKWGNVLIILTFLRIGENGREVDDGRNNASCIFSHNLLNFLVDPEE